MKYIKLFENFSDDKQKELADEFAAYFGVNLDTFAETSKIMAMSPEGKQRWFDAEMDKEEPNIPVIEELERLGYKFDLLNICLIEEQRLMRGININILLCILRHGELAQP